MRRSAHRPPTYRVRWEIDVEADSALDAVRRARRLQVGARTTAKVFDTWPRDAPSKSKRVDLCARDPDDVEPADVLLAIVEAFPGLLDGETDVNGADLVEFVTRRLGELTYLEDFVPEHRVIVRP